MGIEYWCYTCQEVVKLLRGDILKCPKCSKGFVEPVLDPTPAASRLRWRRPYFPGDDEEGEGEARMIMEYIQSLSVHDDDDDDDDDEDISPIELCHFPDDDDDDDDDEDISPIEHCYRGERNLPELPISIDVIFLFRKQPTEIGSPFVHLDCETEEEFPNVPYCPEMEHRHGESANPPNGIDDYCIDFPSPKLYVIDYDESFYECGQMSYITH